jgi:hypothetical protein
MTIARPFWLQASGAFGTIRSAFPARVIQMV